MDNGADVGGQGQGRKNSESPSVVVSHHGLSSGRGQGSGKYNDYIIECMCWIRNEKLMMTLSSVTFTTEKVMLPSNH